jgi:hypothetical protein
MKHSWLYYLSLFFIVFFFSCTDKKTTNITLTNNTNIERPAAMAIITYDKFVGEMGEIPAGQLPIVRDGEGQTIPYQLDDLNNDGTWDELAFTVSLGGNSSKEVSLGLVNESEKPKFAQSTNIRFAALDNPEKEIKEEVRLESGDTEITSKIWQMEGPAWENDKVGFRNYLDARNGFDIFGKVTSEMVLDKAGINGQNYHEMDDWGMDILKVGNSLGAGATAIRSGQNLVRVGSDGTNTYEYLTEGPVRSMFRLNYQVKIPGREQPIKMEREISIRKGEYGYRSKLHFSDIDQEDKLLVGFVNKYGADLITKDAGDNSRILATHTKQSINEEYLGMGLILPRNHFISSGKFDKEHKNISETYYGSLEVSADESLDVFFFAGWEKTNTSFSKQAYFLEKLKQRSIILENPVKVSWN